MSRLKLTLPCERETILNLKSGDSVQITGTLYMARDAAHKKMTDEYNKTGHFPIEIVNQGIYYAGPAPAYPGKVIGPAGPTTSMRMDSYTPLMLDLGLAVMIGKGNRSKAVIESIKKNKAVYLAAAGGAAALISRSIKKQEIIAYDDLGAEALRKLYVEDFPAIVIIDCNGNNLYEVGKAEYRKTEI